MTRARVLINFSAVLVVLALLAVLLLVFGPRFGGSGGARRGGLSGSNPALDIRYKYDPQLFTPAPFVANEEFPLRLDATGFSFYGKRVQGLGAMLAKAPGPLLYDFVGSQQADAFELWYRLKPVGQPLYEDATLGQRLALHQVFTYELGGEDSFWPEYFPETVKLQDKAYLEGWALFSDEDLFFFYAVAMRPLTTEQRAGCLRVLNSLEFNALLGSAAEPAADGAVAPNEAKPPAADAPTPTPDPEPATP